MKKIFYLTIAAFSALNAAEVKKCVEYNPKDFILKQYISNGNKSSTIKANLEDLKIYYFYKKGKLSKATVEYKVNGHRFLTLPLLR